MKKRIFSKITLKILLVVFTVLLLLLPFLPYSVVRYDDGGTVRVQALTYVVMKWNCNTVEIDADGNWNEIPQQTRVYFLPDQFKSYEALWAIRH